MHFVSSGGNHYLYSPYTSQFLLIHPLVAFYGELEKKGLSPRKWANRIRTDTVEVEGIGRFTREDVLYYLKKYIFLRQAGFFRETDPSARLTARLTGDYVRRLFTGTGQVVLEVTDACNLKCEYCAYGEMYDNHDRRSDKKMAPQVAGNLLDFIFESWDANRKSPHGRGMTLSFYGGEPLLNMTLIRHIADRTHVVAGPGKTIELTMTTNGTLLQKHMSYLVDNNFAITISLDGDKTNNTYRRFRSGLESHEIVYGNAKALQREHADFFNENVRFSSVLHDRNSYSEVQQYFLKNFSKSAVVTELNPVGVSRDMETDFRRKFKSKVRDFLSSDEKSQPTSEFVSDNPLFQTLAMLLVRKSGYVFESCNDLLTSSPLPVFPTGTCLPFSRKIYVTVEGKIFPCERIGHRFPMGTMSKEGLDIDFEDIAAKYSSNYRKMMPLCLRCYQNFSCPKCMFQLDMQSDQPECDQFADGEKYSGLLSICFSYLEEHPEEYDTLLKEYTVI